MRDTDLFQLALGLLPPWLVKDCQFSVSEQRLDLYIDFAKGGSFTCADCGQAGCPAYDTEERTWRHLNFFQHETYLHARVPRAECPQCGVKTVAVPWARPGSGFTLLFEALVMTLVRQMPVRAASRIVGEHDTRLWRIVHHYVGAARAQADLSGVRRVGIDETASRRGHHYISVFVDLDRAKVVHVAPGKDGDTVASFAADLAVHGGAASQVAEVCIDMSPAFQAGVREHLPAARITFDKFHVTRLLNQAVDQVRRAEQGQRAELKRTRYLWLKNRRHLTVGQRARLADLEDRRLNLKTARALRLRESFQDFYDQPPEWAGAYLKRWYFWATHSRLAPLIDVARTIREHQDGILRWFQTRVTNGLLEGINSLIQAAKAKARGYRTLNNLMVMVYLVAGKLDFET